MILTQCPSCRSEFELNWDNLIPTGRSERFSSGSAVCGECYRKLYIPYYWSFVVCIASFGLPLWIAGDAGKFTAIACLFTLGALVCILLNLIYLWFGGKLVASGEFG